MEIVDNKCPSCRANLDYDAKKKNWNCEYCHSTYHIESLKKLKHNIKHSINELVCPNCNAKLLVYENIIATKCVYCRNNVIVNKTNDKFSMPDKIIPFSINKEMAKEKFCSILDRKKLLPDDFSLEKNIEDIQGVYVPFWLFSNKYKVNIRYTGDNYHTEKKKAHILFKFIPFDANKHLDNKITKALEPFNYNEITAFDTSYLSGFMAQKYDVSFEVGIEDVASRCKKSIYNIFTDTSSKNYISDVSMINELLVSQDKHYALFPVWFLNINYNNQFYLIAINGQTGKIAGKLPIDTRKYRKLTMISMILSIVVLSFIFGILRWVGVV